MKSKRETPDLDVLRRKAEQAIRTKTRILRKIVPQDEQSMLHELETHQIELEMQNEELRRAQLELEESQHRYAALYDFAPIGYFVFDRKGVIRSANLTGASILGQDRQHVVNKPFSAFVLKEDQESFFEHLKEVFDREVKHIREVRMLRPDKSLSHVQLQSVIAEVKEGEPSTCRTALIDITDRKKAEESSLKLNKDLAVQNEELEALNRELASFVYSVSHDLRAPVRTMAGFSDIMIQDYADKIDEKGKDYLSRIHASSEKMNRLIEDLLKLSRITRQDIERSETNLSDKAAEVVANLREADPRRNVDIVIQPGIKAFADPQLIEVVLSNLLGNAWKFTSKIEKARIEFGVIKKTVRGAELGVRSKDTRNSELRTPNSERVYFVRDNGAGFDPAYVDKMFRPFHRLHSEEEFKGTGIGLAIVERIIRRHGGKVWAEGEPGKGATVYFTLA